MSCLTAEVRRVYDSPIANPGIALAEELCRHSEQDAAVTPMDAVADARAREPRTISVLGFSVVY